MKKICIKTFGCQMNVCDSERIGDILREAGWEEVSNDTDADLVLFNTCCVRGSAEERAFGCLTLMKPWKTQKPERLLVLCGCIPQRDGSALLERFPFLDLVIGTRDYFKLPLLIERVMETGERLAVTGNIGAELPEIQTPRHPHGVTAFVNIMYGCDNFCSYCIVPFVRGHEVSRSKNDILREISQLIEEGVKETTLLGQNVNSYHDTTSGADFGDLLAAVNELPGLERIRFTTSHPGDVSEKLIRAIAQLSHVCEQIHLPVQAGSDAVLARMNRGYKRKDYLALVGSLRDEIPDVAITTDLMVGFPGETESDFQETLDLCRKVRWDAAFMFIYSVRKGTAAAKLVDDVPNEVKKARISELINLQEKISAEKNAALVGSMREVLIERRSSRNPHDMAGRDRGGHTIVFPSGNACIGEIVNVHVKHSTAHTLMGEITGVEDFKSGEKSAASKEPR